MYNYFWFVCSVSVTIMSSRSDVTSIELLTNPKKPVISPKIWIWVVFVFNLIQWTILSYYLWMLSYIDRCFVSCSWSLLIFPIDYLYFHHLLKNYLFSLDSFSLIFSIFILGGILDLFPSPSLFFCWYQYPIILITSALGLEIERIFTYSSCPNFESPRVVCKSMGS